VSFSTFAQSMADEDAQQQRPQTDKRGGRGGGGGGGGGGVHHLKGGKGKHAKGGGGGGGSGGGGGHYGGNGDDDDGVSARALRFVDYAAKRRQWQVCSALTCLFHITRISTHNHFVDYAAIRR
jgi:hypothetical protein